MYSPRCSLLTCPPSIQKLSLATPSTARFSSGRNARASPLTHHTRPVTDRDTLDLRTTTTAVRGNHEGTNDANFTCAAFRGAEYHTQYNKVRRRAGEEREGMASYSGRGHSPPKSPTQNIRKKRGERAAHWKGNISTRRNHHTKTRVNRTNKTKRKKTSHARSGGNGNGFSTRRARPRGASRAGPTKLGIYCEVNPDSSEVVWPWSSAMAAAKAALAASWQTALALRSEQRLSRSNWNGSLVFFMKASLSIP